MAADHDSRGRKSADEIRTGGTAGDGQALSEEIPGLAGSNLRGGKISG